MQLLAEAGGVHDADAVVQDELFLQEDEAEAARRAALAPPSCFVPSPAPASWTR